MEIIVQDNFLEQNVFEDIKTILLGNELPWFYNEHKTWYPDWKESWTDPDLASNKNFQFCHSFYNQHRMSNWFHVIQPFIDILKPAALSRIKANITTAWSRVEPYAMHTDNEYDGCTTAIFYTNTTNGGTIFEDGARIDCLENRMVIFPSELRHAGETFTDGKVRCVINFNYFKEKYD